MIGRSLEFVKWPRLLVWHIATTRGSTVCGLLLPSKSSEGIHYSIPPARRIKAFFAANRVCRSCDRMKDAETMRLR